MAQKSLKDIASEFDVLSEVGEAEELSEAQWRKITSSWPNQAKEFCLEQRSEGEQQRMEVILRNIPKIQGVIAASLMHNGRVPMTVSLMCLSNEVLDRIIRSFQT